MKKKYVFLLILFLFILSPFSAYSTPVLYSVSGDWDGRDVFGTMVIDDSYSWFRMCEEPGHEHCGDFAYNIENFTFSNGRDLFYGHDGSIFGAFCIGIACINFESDLYGEGHFRGKAITQISWYCADFYTEDGLCIEVQEGCPLSPRIRFEDTESVWPEPGFFTPQRLIEFELERITPQSQPVPEPATMLLLGFGLICLVALTRKFRKR